MKNLFGIILFSLFILNSYAIDVTVTVYGKGGASGGSGGSGGTNVKVCPEACSTCACAKIEIKGLELKGAMLTPEIIKEKTAQLTIGDDTSDVKIIDVETITVNKQGEYGATGVTVIYIKP